MDNEKKSENKIKKPVIHILEAVSYLILTVLLLLFLQELVTPKYMSFPYEGAMMAEYYKSEPPHDVIFLGDCEFYESISPVTLWEEYGISSYVRGSPQQLIWQSYYVLLDTLEKETPAVVVMNAMEMKIGEVQKEAYTRMTLDGLNDLSYRLKAADLSIKEEKETLISYALPLLRYHSRWSELKKEDWSYLFHRDVISHAGYLMHNEIEPQTVVLPTQPLPDYTFPDICWSYLDKIRLLCAEKGIEFMLFKAPTDSWQYPWYEEWNEQLEEYAKKYGIVYINGPDHTDEMGLDMRCDSYDGGIHLNVFGAEKCSSFLGYQLKKFYLLPDRRQDSAVSEQWTPLCDRYYKERNTQKEQ